MQFQRREFLKYGSVALMSQGLVQVLAARAEAGASRPRARACILLFQVGGPYQADTFDPKPNAPAEVRGPYRPLATRIPGLHLTEALPRLSAQADKLALLRGVHHTIRCHNPAIYCSLVGREATDPLAVSNQTAARRTDHPHYASVVARLRGPRSNMPHHIVIPNLTTNGAAKSPGLLGGYLGAAYDPFVLGADPNAADYHIDSLTLPAEVAGERFQGRQSLLQRFDGAQRRLEGAGAVAAMGTHYRRAFSLLAAPATKVAFDLEQEPARLRDRYGRHTQGQSALLARRLVEAGVPFVSVFSHTALERESWDTHNNHNELCRTRLLPPADQAFSALLEDLAQRGLLNETLVVWLGEFGRTPRMGVRFSNAGNTASGRDHWCNCYSVALAGGGIRGGQVIGSSDGIAVYPRERPVHISELAATIFHLLGVNPRADLTDIQGQFRTICDGNPVLEAL